MEPATLRLKFVQAVERFNSGVLDIPGFWEEVEALNRAGLSRELKEGEEADAVGQLTWSLDMFDSRLQPRPGLMGRLRDILGAAVRDEYRISEEEVKARALAVERIMKS
jgi:hypothetical protein